MSRLSQLRRMNPDFDKAIARGESWALKRAFQIEEIDRPTRLNPEREFDGQPHHHCEDCPFPEGCVVCDLQ